MENITVQRDGKNGSLTRLRIVNGSALQGSMPSVGYVYHTDGDDLVISVSKNDIAIIENTVTELNRTDRPVSASTNGKNRVMVAAGTYDVGDTINGMTITGLGCAFSPNVDQYSANGISPDVVYVQYAYFC